MSRLGVLLLTAIVAASLIGSAARRDTKTSILVAAPTDAPSRSTAFTGAIDIAAEAGDQLDVMGWVAAENPVMVTVSSGRMSVDVLADQRRFDVEAAVGTSAWGFNAALPASADPTVCVSAGDEDIDCVFFACSKKMFARGFRRNLQDEFPDQRFTAHVIDTRTGCTYELNPGMRITTASVVKVEILGGVLLQAQRGDRELTDAEVANIDAMMHFSLNPQTGALWVQVGGVAGLGRLDREFGVTDTTHVQPFGATWSMAEDRTIVSLAVLTGAGGPLDGTSVDQAWKIMTGVHPAQQWGISAGVAEGYEVANKNGFYPMTGYGWRVGSTGFVADPSGGGYALTIMTDFNVTQADGVELVETIAKRVSSRLTLGKAADRPFDDVTCVTHHGGQSWTSLALELGLSASEADEVRIAAGGDGPLRGQLVCTP